VFFAKDINGLMKLSQLKFQLTQISESLHSKSLRLLNLTNHGMESNKNIPFCKHKIDSQLDHTDGLMLDTREPKDLSIVQLEEM